MVWHSVHFSIIVHTHVIIGRKDNWSRTQVMKSRLQKRPNNVHVPWYQAQPQGCHSSRGSRCLWYTQVLSCLGQCGKAPHIISSLEGQAAGLNVSFNDVHLNNFGFISVILRRGYEPEHLKVSHNAGVTIDRRLIWVCGRLVITCLKGLSISGSTSYWRSHYEQVLRWPYWPTSSLTLPAH
jgi:hypothetical protein